MSISLTPGLFKPRDGFQRVNLHHFGLKSGSFNQGISTSTGGVGTPVLHLLWVKIVDSG